jgi:hypothetical protein
MNTQQQRQRLSSDHSNTSSSVATPKTPEPTRRTSSKTPAASEPRRTLSPSPSMSSVGSQGAAARRRMRTQMRLQRSNTTGHDTKQATPPPSPPSNSKIKRLPSDSSVGSRGKSTDHVVNYLKKGSTTNVNNTTGYSANRSTGSAGASAAESSTDSELNLFDPTNSHGFTFDAFGLDASEINREVSEAMQDLAGTLDISLFLEQDPADAWKWDSSSSMASQAVSSSTTPEQDGFVDGFRITKTNSLPVHIRQSPTRSEKSNLTSESYSQQQPAAESTNMNPFKVEHMQECFSQAIRKIRVVFAFWTYPT